MDYDIRKELWSMWSRWAKEEYTCSCCGKVSIPSIQNKRQAGQIKPQVFEHKHLPTNFDYICILCGELVNKDMLPYPL